MVPGGRRWLWRVGVTAVMVPLVVALAWQRGDLLVGSVAGSPRGVHGADVCLPGREVPVQPSPHIAQSAAGRVRYDTLPATSGPHFGVVVAPGVFDTDLAEALTVHSLEHGHIVIRYATSTPPGEVELLEAIARRHSGDVLLAPQARLRSGVALTAWGRLEVVQTPSGAAVERFLRSFAGRYDHGWQRDGSC